MALRSPRLLLAFGIGLCLLLFLSTGRTSTSSSSSSATFTSTLSEHGNSPLGSRNGKPFGGLKTTRFLSSQPGFNVIENIYWHNWTWIIVTDQPNLIPPLELVSTLGYQRDPAVEPLVPAVLWSIRNPPVGSGVSEEKQKGKSITLEDAVDMFGDAEEIPGPMMLNNDDELISHYYHWMGEMFLGSWRIWCNLAWRAGLAAPPDFETIGFVKQWPMDKMPEGTTRSLHWEDPAGANAWFMHKFFPKAKIETRIEWAPRAASDRLYRLPMVVLTDRRAGHAGPSSGFKPFGDVLRLPVPVDWLLRLRDRALKHYHGHVTIAPGRLPRVAYLTRQDTRRRLANESHDALLEELQKLQEDGVASVSILQFSEETPFEDQLATMASLDVLIGVHGNGLTHALWMSPGPQKAVFELQPKDCHINDFSPLAVAAGIEHYLVNGDTYCLPADCHSRGCTGTEPELKTVNRGDIHIVPTVVTDEIRRIFGAGRW